MTDQDLEQKLKEFAAATAPRHSLVTRVMQQVNEAHQPRRRSFLWGLPTSSGLRAAAAILAIAAGIAVIVVGVHSLRTPRHPAPMVTTMPSPEPAPQAAIRALDIRRIDLKSPNSLDDVLRDGSVSSAGDRIIRVADLSRPDLNLY
jgi:anti-sigma-K factor RskA